MLTLKSAAHIATGRNLKSFHACPASTGLPMTHLDCQRIDQEAWALARRTLRRFWLARRWNEHVWRCRRRRTRDEG